MAETEGFDLEKIRVTDEQMAKMRVNTGDIERQKITERFGAYRRPTEVTIPKFKAIQEKSQELALLIHDLCPYSQQKASALTQLEMCKMSANAAIAIHTGDPNT